ncbi:PQQ-dependent sugar dehydrogenase [Lipingzhangella sp. LS1_29]|uniref:PQQ-dependent sugar dehydrogenase n=1 Tax=Lipingzhangella rawalii TaxID=2055835 RepID=A0ABU2HAP0_9ACTN|nr:PQQ-dependent sugar dehydrogenase [Lipingzhangella rawalii]MDS1272399.1 PQQ-dependent sugar dehydrogenase [Lipingzhangella rawalii]
MNRTVLISGVATGLVVLAAGGGFLLLDENTADTPTTGTDEDPTAPDAPRVPDPQPEVDILAEGFDQPWGLDVLPGADRLLVTERPGALSLVDTASGEVTEIDGIPEVTAQGQGGLLDVAVHPDFPESDWIYLTYSAAAQDTDTTTHLARARLDPAAAQLVELEPLFAAEPSLPAHQHYGSTVAFGPDGMVYLTVGDRGDKNFDDHPAQDTTTTLGTTVRLEPDGSIPEDNPFVGAPGVADEIYSYGHRNVQAMAFHPQSGQLWQAEHGEEDGDEINVVQEGGNHGWPEAHTGCEYGTDTPIGDHPADREDIVDPVHYWECGSGGFPPSGMTFYQGEEFPSWQGDLLVGTLAGQYLARFTVDERRVEEADPLLDGEGMRIRNVAVGPSDGVLYVAVDDSDAPVLRITNAAEQ